MNCYTSMYHCPATLSAGDLAKALNVSQTTAYRLLHSDDFPVVMIGKRRMVTKHDLIKWMNKQIKVALN